MSLKIYCGSRIDNLAEKLKELLLKDRQGWDPFDFSKVVVPSANVAKWLQIRKFAAEPSLCAGVEFPFMEKELTKLMVAALPPEERADVELLPDRAYVKAIVSILLSDSEKQLAPFRKYITNSDSADSVAITEQKQAAMAWQLADKLADLMDSYEVYRPEIVEWWLKGGRLPYDFRKGEAAEAEAALARALWGENGKFKSGGKRLSLRQLYNRVKERTPDDSQKTIYFFGQSTLSVLQAQILVWLAKTHKVVVFYRNPCREFWGDIETAKEERKIRCMSVSGVDPEENYSCKNELLKVLGIAGRETLRLLVELEESADVAERIGFEWELIDEVGGKAETVLEKVQESIRCQTSEVARRRQDASVQVVGTPGVRREVEMIYNSILGSVTRPEGVTGERPWPDCSFSDIAVIVPDMQTYRPVIEAVFDARGEVPYGLLDTTASEDSLYLRGFLSLVELGRKGLNRERLFNVLANPCVQRAMGFAREDVVSWRNLTEKIGAFDGFEHEEDSDGYFDWSSALNRLRLARISNTVIDVKGDEVPLVKDGGDYALKFSEVVELLYRDLTDTLFDNSGKPRVLPLLAARRDDGTREDCWASRLEHLAKAYLAVEKDDKLENQVSESIIGTLYSLGGIFGGQSFELAVAAVEHFVGGISCRTGGYLTSGVTIGGFASLAALPFKQVYMMGMGAGGFPGRTSDSTLDVRGTGWRLGDVSAPNRNRFLFLESIMSVRDRLVLSYPNLDIEKDAELFPSGIVLDVEKFIGKHVLDYDAQTEESGFQEFNCYPLLERGESGPRKDGEKRPTDDIVWTKDDPCAGLLPTYSKAARELARARAGGKGNLPEVKKVVSERAKPRIEISAKVLADFLKNPVRAVMRYRFGISVADYLETDLDSDSPLGSLDGPDLWNLQAKWLDSDAKLAVGKEIRRLQRAGKMPMGFLGEYAKSVIMKKAEKGLAQIQDFVAGFGLSDGEDNTLHLDCPTEFGTGTAEGMKVRFVAEIPNWKETANEVAVLVTGLLGDKPPQLPTESCFAAVLAYLMKVHSKKSTARRLRVGVADLKNGTICAWTWDGINEKAGEYLETLTRTFLTYEQTCDGKMVDFTSKKLLKALNEAKLPYVWGDIQEKVTAEDQDHSKSSFNNDLVIEQNIERFKREPEETGGELKGIYESRYELPLSGKRLGAAEREVGHE